METQTGKEEAGEGFARFPRFPRKGLVSRGGSHLASQFGKSEALPDDLGNGKIEATSIVKFFRLLKRNICSSR